MKPRPGAGDRPLGVVVQPVDVGGHWVHEWTRMRPSLRFHLANSATAEPERPVSAACVELHRQPDGSAWFHAVGQMTAAEAARLLLAARQEAERHQVRLVHSAAFRPLPLSAQLLRQMGFSQEHAVEQWRAETVCSEPQPASWQVGRLLPVSAAHWQVRCEDRQWSVSLASVVRLILETLQEAVAGIGAFVPRAADLLNLWQMMVPTVEMRVAVHREKLLGLLVTSREGTTTTVQYLGLRPAQRRQGGGRLLLSALSDGPVEAFVMSHNESAREFYGRMGFSRQRQDAPWFWRMPSAVGRGSGTGEETEEGT